VKAIHKTIDFEELVRSQENDAELKTLFKDEEKIKLTKVQIPEIYYNTSIPITDPYCKV